MPTTAKKISKTTETHPNKAEILKKLNKSTRTIKKSTILPLLKEKGAEKLTLAELRKRLSILKTPLSQEIIAERATI